MARNYPTQSEICIPLLRAIERRGGEISFSRDGTEIERELADHFGLTEAQRLATDPKRNSKGKRIWRNDIQYARLKLVECGEMDKSVRDRWKLTEAGRSRIGDSSVASGLGPAHSVGLLERHNYRDLQEGTLCTEAHNRWERNRRARQMCVEHYGAACVICGFRSVNEYGPAIVDLIQVHHLVPLSEIGSRYEVNPIDDLRPVCPNCHAVIHFGGVTRSVADVQRLWRSSV